MTKMGCGRYRLLGGVKAPRLVLGDWAFKVNNCLFQPTHTDKKAVESILELKVARGQRGGVALIMLISFMVMAVPIALAANQVSDQLVRSSMVYEGRMTGSYNAASGVELALANLLDEEFRDTLVPGDDPVDLSMEINGKEVFVEITTTVLGKDAFEGGESGSADIVMVLDNSQSIVELELLDLKDAANAIVDAFDLAGSEDRMAMGLTRFSDASEGLVEMTVDPTQLHSGIDNLETWNADLPGGTNIMAGILGGVDQLSTGLEDRPEVSKVLIFITDGNDTNDSDGKVEEIALFAETSGAEIFAIGVGSNVSPETLCAIAYDPEPADAEPADADCPYTGHVYHLDDFVELLLIIDGLVEEVIGSAATASIYVIESTTASGSNLRA